MQVLVQPREQALGNSIVLVVLAVADQVLSGGSYVLLLLITLKNKMTYVNCSVCPPAQRESTIHVYEPTRPLSWIKKLSTKRIGSYCFASQNSIGKEKDQPTAFRL